MLPLDTEKKNKNKISLAPGPFSIYVSRVFRSILLGRAPNGRCGEMSGEQHYSQARKALLEEKQEKNGIGNSCATAKDTPALPCFYSASWRLVSQGAEARVWFVPNYLITSFNSTSVTHNYEGKTASLTTASSSAVCKERFHKSYRHQCLNVQLTKTRIKSEVKCITKCRKHGINVPLILGVDLSRMCIFMEFLEGKTVREVCII